MTGRAGTATSPAPPAPPRRSPRQSAGSWTPLAVLCVPKTSSMSCDQAVFVDQATGVSLPSDAVPVEIDRFG